VNRLERSGEVALNNFQFGQIPALVEAIQVGEAAKALAQKKGRAGFAANPLYALQTMLDTVENRAGQPWQHQTLLAHQSAVYTAAFSPDGKRIVTASSDKTGRVWDAETGREIASLNGHQDYVITAAFSPDGKRIVTASLDKTGRVWPVENLDRLLVRGCNWLKNYLIVNPQVLAKLSTCQTADLTQPGASILMKQSEALAREGKINEAIEGFKIAQKWNPSLRFDPVSRANQLANDAKKEK
ncbi:MAG: WD40 repeat domain-containing protein, partial [Microcystis aeruginosa]